MRIGEHRDASLRVMRTTVTLADDVAAIEHGLTLCSADTDFARFRKIRWENPIAA